MLLTKCVEIVLNNRNIKHYKKILENDELTINEKIMVDISIVTLGSHVIVDVLCDDCGEKKQMSYKTYNHHNFYDGYFCIKCVNANKTKKTNILKYGCESPIQNEEINKKIKETTINRYGTEYALQNMNVLEKRNKTNILKYGTEHVSLNTDVRNKQTLTKIKNIIDKINYSFVSYDYETHLIKSICDEGHVFEISAGNIYNRLKYNTNICLICNPIGHFYSDVEHELINFIKSNYTKEILLNSRKIIPPYELDIFLPDLNLAFEFNGLYWHSEIYKDKNYHYNKTNVCIEKNIDLNHIWEDDWCYKKDYIKNNILQKINEINEINNDDIIFIKEIINDECLLFLKNNYNGDILLGDKNVGAFRNNELVSLMSFKNTKITCFCDKINYFNKNVLNDIISYYIKKYNKREINITIENSYKPIFIDHSFKCVKSIRPKYMYVVNRIRTKTITKKCNKIYDSGYTTYNRNYRNS